ncbi:thioredoxin-like protein [Pyronema domesticum]|nr:thioredoxin-like protein [Pyronema domesticum]
MSKYTHVTSPLQLSGLAVKNSVVVIDFHATWCGPCRVIAPTFDALANKHAAPGKVAFVKVDVDQAQTIAQQYEVRAMPTFIILVNNKEVARIQGADSRALTNAVEKHCTGVSKSAYASTGGQKLGSAPVGGYVKDGTMGRKPARIAAGNWVDTLIRFMALYLVSLFAIDARGAAERSSYRTGDRTLNGNGGGSGRPGGPGGPGGRKLGGVSQIRRDTGGCAGGSCG